jgi:hypothetical protein
VLKYLKAAFEVPWNMLAFFGALGFAALSGQPDVAIPIVLAGEAAYVGMLGANAKFQSYVDAQEAKTEREANSEQSSVVLQRILKGLPDSSRRRYADLLNRCRQLRQIAADLKHSGSVDVGVSLDSLQTEGLDRLLWIYLRLLFTEHALTKFLRGTSRDAIEGEAARLEARMAELDPQDQSPHTAKVRRTLEDSMATIRERLANYDRARSNFEFVQLEIERLEFKIKSLAELAVNRQEPDYISSQIDQVARSMHDTEKTMNDLQYVTGLDGVDEGVPPVLQETVREVE